VPVPTAITPDATLVAGAACFADGGGEYAVWDVSSGRLLFQGDGKVFSLAFSPDGSLFAAGDNDGNIALWSVAEGRRLTVLKDDRLSIRSLAFAGDMWVPTNEFDGIKEWLLASGDEGGNITIWEVARRTVRTRFHGSNFHVYTLAFNPDSTLLASAGRKEARLWDVATGRLVLTIGAGDAHTSLAFSPDGRRLAVASQKKFTEGQVRVYELQHGRGVNSLRGLTGPFGSICFSPDRKWLAALTHNWQVGIWEAASGRLHRIFRAPKDVTLAPYATMAFSPNSHRLAFLNSDEGTVWEVATGRRLHHWKSAAPYGRDPVEESKAKLWKAAASGSPAVLAHAYAWDSSGELLQFSLDSSVASKSRYVQILLASWRPSVFRIIFFVRFWCWTKEKSCYLTVFGNFGMGACESLSRSMSQLEQNCGVTPGIGLVVQIGRLDRLWTPLNRSFLSESPSQAVRLSSLKRDRADLWN
jgi:WD40 repeat protein